MKRINFSPKYVMLEKMENVSPGRNFIFSAIENLDKPEDIMEFFKEYCEWLKENGKFENNQKAVDVANSNIGYILIYYDTSKVKQWHKVLQTVSHPIFGRKTDIGVEEAFQMGVQLGESMKNKIKE